PGLFNYLREFTYDGTHDLLLTSKTEAQHYYDHLLATVFSREPEFRTVTLFYDGMSYSTWKSQYESQLVAFLNKTGVPYDYTLFDISSRTIADVMVKIAFGK
ncbi:MAG: hypothetical protein J6P88_02620, partial [Clostridia bacterium]|nr:hypothetical protein [Clostridia bacterium]